MAQLREPDKPTPTGELPPELAVCYVEDWDAGGNALAAWRRWGDARRAWAGEHGLDHRRYPSGAPVWRSTGLVVGLHEH